MYRIFYGNKIIFDPYGDENEIVSDASLSANLNASAYLDFKMAINHPLYTAIAEKSDIVKLLWDDNVLFEGQIESIDIDIKGTKSVSCVSALDYLNDTIVRPYSTVKGESDLTAPSSVDGYFQWLIDQHNTHVKDSNKLFYIGVNQGANLQQNNFIYRSSTNNPTTASEISSQILDSLGGYLSMRYEDGRHVLNLYSDVHSMNAQIIDFGVNLKDFSKKIDTNDQYTALIAKGGSPQFMNGGFESGDFSYWESHPGTAIVTDKAQEGSYSSYVVEGVAKYVPASFFYAKKNGRYKSTVYVKNERQSDIVVHAGYQTNVLDSWSNDSKTVPFTIPNDDQWHECSYEFSTGVENNTKIRPYWYSDNISNSGNSRVYFDSFEFSRLIGNNTVSEDPIDLTLIPNGGTRYDSDIIKSEDVIYNPNRVSRYGYREKVFTDSTITNVEDLMQAAIKELNKLAEPTIGLDVKAVDLALYMDGYTHLNVGDAVRVRSAIHNTDEYLMVSSINLNLQDPENSEYVIGQAYDSLTGQQSGYLRSLSAGINSSLDTVASLDQTIKDQAIKIGSVTEVANKAQETATSASSKADNAKKTADNAQKTADTNKEQIDTIKNKQSEQDALIDKVKQDISSSEAEIGGINDRITQMDSEIDKAQSDINAARQEAQKNFDMAKAAADAAQSDADAATKRASDLSDDLDATKATVNQTVTEFGEVKTTATNAASKADQSLRVSTQASQTATSASQKATSAYEDAQTAINKSSEAVQTANNVSLSLKTDYQTKSDADAKYATQASLNATSDQIKTEVSKTYATQATVNALENIANNAVQTWMGNAVPTLSNKPASDWKTSALKAQHSGDIYYDTDTGYSYRFGSSDGSTYSWALIKDTDISKALADAAKAQKTADAVTSNVTELKTSIPVTYATKSELTQKADSITSRVEEVAQAGTATSAKATQLEQKTDEINSTVSDQGSKLNNAVTTISQVSQKADSISSTVQQVQGDLNSLDFGGTNLVKLGYYHFNGSVTNTSYNRDQDLYAFTVPANLPFSRWGYGIIPKDRSYVYAGVPWGKCGILSFYMYSDRACTINIDVNCYPMTASAGSGNDHDNTSERAKSSYSIPANQWVQVWCRWENSNSTESTGNPTKDDMYDISPIGVISSSNAINVKIKRIKFEVGTKPTAWSPCPEDVDANIRTAQGTANSALSKASTVEQTLDGFKTNVSQTYETKQDALNKQSTLNQKIDGLRSEVSQTYTTKTDFNNLQISGGRNIARDTKAFGRNNVTDKDSGYLRICVDRTNGTYNGCTVRSLTSSDANLQAVFEYGVNNVDPGEYYTLSFWAKGSGTMRLYSYGPSRYIGARRVAASDGQAAAVLYNDGYTNMALSSGWKRYWVVWQLNNNPPGGYNTTKYFLLRNDNKMSSCDVCGVMIEKGNKASEWAPAPEDIEKTYATKSYVDQTARTVSLGVVEEYKKGQHGSALATQSDISVAKDSITSTVSKTYTTKTDFNNLQIGGTNRALLTSTPKSLTGNNTSNQNMALYNMAGKGYELFGGDDVMISYDIKASGSALSGTYVIQGNGNTGWGFVVGPPSRKLSDIGNGKTMHVADKVKFGSDSAHNFNGFKLRMDNASGTLTISNFKIEKGNKATSWSPAPEDIEKTYATKSEVKQTADGLSVTISGIKKTADSAVTKADNAQNTANTANNKAANAQTSANTANSNATNAQNRVGNLETCIKMTADGVRVGKITNGNFSGYSALVNSAGSFDILDATGSNKLISVDSSGLKTSFVNGSPKVIFGALNGKANMVTKGLLINGISATPFVSTIFIKDYRGSSHQYTDGLGTAGSDGCKIIYGDVKSSDNSDIYLNGQALFNNKWPAKTLIHINPGWYIFSGMFNIKQNASNPFDAYLGFDIVIDDGIYECPGYYPAFRLFSNVDVSPEWRTSALSNIPLYIESPSWIHPSLFNNTTTKNTMDIGSHTYISIMRLPFSNII